MRFQASKKKSQGWAGNSVYGENQYRNLTLCLRAQVDPDKAFAVQVAHEEGVLTTSAAYMQCALLYTSSSGERRIRCARPQQRSLWSLQGQACRVRCSCSAHSTSGCHARCCTPPPAASGAFGARCLSSAHFGPCRVRHAVYDAHVVLIVLQAGMRAAVHLLQRRAAHPVRAASPALTLVPAGSGMPCTMRM